MASLSSNIITRQWRGLHAFAPRYGAAHFGKSLFWHGSEILYAFFLTEMVGSSGRDMAIIVAGGLVASAAIDIWLARQLGTRHISLRDASRLQWIGAVASAVTVTLIAVTGMLPASLRLAYGIASGLMFRIAYGLYDIAQNSMLALATSNKSERAALSALRICASGCASLVIAGGATAALTLTAGREQDGLAAMTGFATLCATGSALLLSRTTTIPQPARTLPMAAEKLHGPNRNDRRFYIAMLLTSFSISSFVRLEPYYVSRLSTETFSGSTFIIATALGLILSQPFWYRVVRRHGSERGLLVATSLLLCALCAFYGLSAVTPFIAPGIALLFGLANGGIGMTIWAGFSQCIAGTGREVLSFGQLTAFSKIGLAIAAALVGWWQSCDRSGAGCPVPIAIPMGFIPAISVAITMVWLLFSVTRRRHSFGNPTTPE